MRVHARAHEGGDLGPVGGIGQAAGDIGDHPGGRGDARVTTHSKRQGSCACTRRSPFTIGPIMRAPSAIGFATLDLKLHRAVREPDGTIERETISLVTQPQA